MGLESAIFTLARLAELEDALLAIAEVMRTGARKPHEHWRAYPATHHLEHARAHLERLAEGDRSEEHLAHAATRLLMALATKVQPHER
jgi:hypothetical protein